MTLKHAPQPLCHGIDVLHHALSLPLHPTPCSMLLVAHHHHLPGYLSMWVANPSSYNSSVLETEILPQNLKYHKPFPQIAMLTTNTYIHIPGRKYTNTNRIVTFRLQLFRSGDRVTLSNLPRPISQIAMITKKQQQQQQRHTCACANTHKTK